MLKVSMDSGLAWAQTFEVEGTLNDDLGGLVDEYVQEHKEDFQTWAWDDLMDIWAGDEDYIDSEFTAINGGEYYTTRILGVEEV